VLERTLRQNGVTESLSSASPAETVRASAALGSVASSQNRLQVGLGEMMVITLIVDQPRHGRAGRVRPHLGVQACLGRRNALWTLGRLASPRAYHGVGRGSRAGARRAEAGAYRRALLLVLQPVSRCRQ
jgi:hypothetical protein